MGENNNFQPDNEMIYRILQAMTTPGEWTNSGGGGYQPPDVGSMAAELNYQQDYMSQAEDPWLRLLSGAWEAGDFQPSVTEKTEGMKNDGATYLTNIIAKTPGSFEAHVADAIMAGDSYTDAYTKTAALDKFKGTDYADSTKPLAIEAKTFAQDAWSKYMTDTPGTTTREVKENPTIQAALDMGYVDPRWQYTPDAVSPHLAAARQRAEDLAEVKRKQVDSTKLQLSDLPMREQGYNTDVPGEREMRALPGERWKKAVQNSILGQAAWKGQSPDAKRSSIADEREWQLKMAGDARRPDVDGKMFNAQTYMTDEERRRNKVAMNRSYKAQSEYANERIKAQALARFLQDQGRTPFTDQLSNTIGVRP